MRQVATFLGMMLVASGCSQPDADAAKIANSAYEADTEEELSAAPSLATTGVAVLKGTRTSEALSVLQKQKCKMGSNADCWGEYIDFTTDADGSFAADFTYRLPSTVDIKTLRRLVVRTAFEGSGDTLWHWLLRNQRTGQFEEVGSSVKIRDWRWARRNFDAEGDLSRFVTSDGSVTVRYAIDDAPGENSLLDLLAVAAQSGGSTPVADGNTPVAAIPAPTGGAGNCGSIWAPPVGATWIWDLGNAAVPAPTLNSAGPKNYSAAVYDVDMYNTSAQQIDLYHKSGKKVVCYIDVGSWESGRPDGGNFSPDCWCGAGSYSNGKCSSNAHKMDGWAEYWFDIRQSSGCAANLKDALAKRIGLARSKGCDAIEPDNVDAYQNKGGGWGITIADQYAFNLWLAQTAHANCMGILLKNAGDMLDDGDGKPTAYTAGLVKAFDGSLNEQCHQYNECGIYSAFGRAGKVMLNAEYPGSSAKASYCGTPGMRTLQYKSLDVLYTNLISACP